MIILNRAVRPGTHRTLVNGFCFTLLSTFILFVAVEGARPAQQEKSTAAPPMAKPESVGLSTAGLNKVHDVVQQHISAGDVPGAIVLVSRNGKVAYWDAQGNVDGGAKAPLEKDTIFWTVSMTKPYVAT